MIAITDLSADISSWLSAGSASQDLYARVRDGLARAAVDAVESGSWLVWDATLAPVHAALDGPRRREAARISGLAEWALERA